MDSIDGRHTLPGSCSLPYSAFLTPVDDIDVVVAAVT